MPRIWAGVDIRKEHHHCVVVDERGERLFSRRVFNDEPALLELIADVLALSEDALWAVDINHGGAALLIGLLLSQQQPMVYITGLAVRQERRESRRACTTCSGLPRLPVLCASASAGNTEVEDPALTCVGSGTRRPCLMRFPDGSHARPSLVAPGPPSLGSTP